MTDVEKIALWVGLIASIVSIVLSVVAIVFARMVDKSARQVSEQTIRSLQKIESYVERLSSDTTGLIKAGWDRMLGTVGKPDPTQETISAREIADGLLAELRAELGITAPHYEEHEAPHTPRDEQLDEALKNLRRSLEFQLRTPKRANRPSQKLDEVLDGLRSLTPEARTIASILTDNLHITFNQFQRLQKESPLGDAIIELRDQGFLIPLEGLSPQLKPIPVYFFPPGVKDLVRAALLLLPEPDHEVRSFVESELKSVGYEVRDINGRA